MDYETKTFNIFNKFALCVDQLNEDFFNNSLSPIPVILTQLEDDELGKYVITDNINDNVILLADNQNLNDHQTLGVLLHELAHHKVCMTYGNEVEPHGNEWLEEMKRICSILEYDKTINEFTTGEDFFIDTI